MFPMILTKSILKKLHEAAVDHDPQEAVGIIVDENHVIVLPNHAADPTRNYELFKSEILQALNELEDPAESIVIWHSHPGGGIGPSRIDLQNKVPDVPHLVISLVDGDAIPTWY